MPFLRHNAAAAVVAASVAACFAVAPTAAHAQKKKPRRTITVETLPPSDGVSRNPWYMGPPDLKAATRLAGCYGVTLLGPWSDALASGDSVPMPSRVDLLDSLHTGFYIGFRLVARTPGFAMPIEKRPPAWSPVDADSLQVGIWHEGTRSVTLFLRRQSDAELRGTARYFTAEHREDSTSGRWLWETYPAAPVSLRPTPCDATGGERHR